MSDVGRVRNELLEAILQEIPTPLDEGSEVCVGMLADGAKRRGLQVTARTIQGSLDAKVEAGELSKRFAIWRGRRVVAYKKSKP